VRPRYPVPLHPSTCAVSRGSDRTPTRPWWSFLSPLTAPPLLPRPAYHAARLPPFLVSHAPPTGIVTSPWVQQAHHTPHRHPPLPPTPQPRMTALHSSRSGTTWPPASAAAPPAATAAGWLSPSPPPPSPSSCGPWRPSPPAPACGASPTHGPGRGRVAVSLWEGSYPGTEGGGRRAIGTEPYRLSPTPQNLRGPTIYSSGGLNPTCLPEWPVAQFNIPSKPPRLRMAPGLAPNPPSQSPCSASWPPIQTPPGRPGLYPRNK